MANDFFWENDPQPEEPREETPAEEVKPETPEAPETPETPEAPAEETAPAEEAAPAEETAPEAAADDAPPANETPAPAETPAWRYEAANAGPAQVYPEPERKKKKHKGLIALAAVIAALAVGVCAVFALDLASIRIRDGVVSMYVGPNASAHTSRNPGGSGNGGGSGKDVDSFLNVKDTPAQTDTTDAEGALTVREIARRNLPSVVGIVTAISNGWQSGSGTGTGIIMTEDGYIVTNAHVIENASSISVILSTGETFDGSVVGSDADSDIAVVKIDAAGLTPAVFASSSTVQVGDLAVAIGNPYGMALQGTVTAGIISAVERQIQVDDNIYTVLQTDAAINNGNSGGPLINAYGEVIGINSVKITETYADGLGFAIPTDVFKPIVDELVQYGYVSGKPSIGVLGTMFTEVYTRYYGVPTGFYVSGFQTNEPSNAGIRTGDIITAINGEKFTTMAELTALKNKYKAGDRVELTIYRDTNYADNKDGEYLTVTVTLSDAEEISSRQDPFGGRSQE